MVTLTEALSCLNSVDILVVGDFILDVYTKGSVQRISPEAPVPVILVSEESELPGGAGNVAINLQALGARVGVVGRIGDDGAGKKLMNLFPEGLFEQKGFQTSKKNRFIASGHQLLRADYEEVTPISKELEKQMEEYLLSEIRKYDLVAVSDYGKGLLSKALLKTIFCEAKRYNIPVVVDPKGTDFSKYSGTHLLKPNNKEAYLAAGCDFSEAIETVAEKLLAQMDIDHLLVTRSERGMILFSRDGSIQDFPVVQKDVRDVTGAGDTVLAMISFCIANRLTLPHAIELANIAASHAIEQLGCVAVKLSEVASRLLQREPACKIFTDESQFFVLEKVALDHPIVHLNLRGEEDISSRTYHLIKETAKRKERKAKLAVEVTNDNQDFIQLLASMHEVDFVLALKQEYART